MFKTKKQLFIRKFFYYKMIKTKYLLAFSLMLGFVGILASCSSEGEKDYTAYNNNTGTEYAPQMYVSTPYEAYSQVEMNQFNPMGLNMRKPVEGTVARVAGMDENLPIELMYNYPIPKDSLVMAARMLKNPIAKTAKNMAAGEHLYKAYCNHCHGPEGNGDGLVAEKYTGVANLNGGAIKNQPSGHIYHVISKGKGRMYAHGSQILPADRWKIVYYVNKIRGYDDSNERSNLLPEEIAELTEIVKDTSNNHIIIRFPFGSSKPYPNPKLEKYLADLASKMNENNQKITLEGHTDNIDTREVNLIVGQNRADYIKNILLSKGASENKIASVSKSFDNPIGDNTTSEGRRQNRRVEIIFN